MRTNLRSIANYKARLVERIKALDPNLASGLRDIKLDWYRIRNVDETEATETEETVAEVFIYDEIGGSLGVSADEFVKDLSAIDADRINVRINSPGGSVFDSIAIYNALVQHPATITTFVDALAASGASIVAMGGDECVMMIGSQLMIHDALGLEMGNAADMREMAKFLDHQSNNIASIYAAKAGGEPDEWRKLMLAETWMLAGEAVDMGLANRVYKPEPKTETPDAENTPPDVPGKPMPGEDDEEKDPTEPENNIDAELEMLMARHHRLANRGFKYLGRNRAPNPLAADNRQSKSHADYVSELVDNMYGGKRK